MHFSENPPDQVADEFGTCSASLRKFTYPRSPFLAKNFAHFFGTRSGKGPFYLGKLLHLFGSCLSAAEAFPKGCRLNPSNTPNYPAFCLPLVFLLSAMWLRPYSRISRFTMDHFAEYPAIHGKNFSGFHFLPKFVLYRYLIHFFINP